MNIYLLTQTEKQGYDTFDSCVVYAVSSPDAKNIHPSGRMESWGNDYGSWASKPEKVTATLIGYADNQADEGVILASFNSG